MKRSALVLLLFLTGCRGFPIAPISPAPGSYARRRGDFHTCLVCHSVKEMQRGPILDGLPAWYVAQELRKFKAGIRGTNSENKGEALMASAMSQKSVLDGEQEIVAVAQYISELPPQPHLLVVRGDADRGKRLYQTTCVACHGDQAQGNLALKAPPLNVQEDYYLLRQINAIQAKDRGYDARDIEAKLMQAAITSLDSTNFPDIIRYVARDLSRTNALVSASSPATP